MDIYYTVLYDKKGKMEVREKTIEEIIKLIKKKGGCEVFTAELDDKITEIYFRFGNETL